MDAKKAQGSLRVEEGPAIDFKKVSAVLRGRYSVKRDGNSRAGFILCTHPRPFAEVCALSTG